MARRPRKSPPLPVAQLLERQARGYGIHHPRVSLKPGVYAFAQPMETQGTWRGYHVPRWASAEHINGATLRSSVVTIGSRTYKLIQFRGGKTELYRVDPDGAEMFLGYADDVLRLVMTGAYSKLPAEHRALYRRGEVPPSP